MSTLIWRSGVIAVSYTHLRAHETVLDLVCRLLLEKKNNTLQYVTRPLNRIDKSDDSVITVDPPIV